MILWPAQPAYRLRHGPGNYHQTARARGRDGGDRSRIYFFVGRAAVADAQGNGWLLLVGWHVGATLTGAGLTKPFGNKWVLLIGAVVGFLLAALSAAVVLLIFWFFIAPGLGGG
jgi:hypothetical protein